MFETKVLSDCSFLVGKENSQLVAGHRTILSAASPVLHDKLKAAEGDPPKVILTDVEPEVFQLMLTYIYTDSIDLKSNTAYDLAAAAKAYQMPYLLKTCFVYIADNLTTKNVLQAYSLALHSTESDELKKKCEEFIKTNTSAVLSDSSFEEACLDVIVAMFSLESLDIDSELDLLNAADRYAKHVSQSNNAECDTLTVRNILEKIRFLSMTPEEFAIGRAATTVLSSSYACAILTNIAYNESGVPMPSGFSLRKDPRKKSNVTAIEVMPEIKFKFRVPDITNLINKDEKAWSSVFKLRNLKWRIGVQTKSKDSKKFLSIYVHKYSENISDTWSCYLEVQFLLLRVDNRKPDSFTYSQTLNKDNVNWGYPELIEASKVLDPNNQYIEDGAITFQIYIKAHGQQK